MKKILNNSSLIDTETKAIIFNADRWYYDETKKQGVLIILNPTDEKEV